MAFPEKKKGGLAALIIAKAKPENKDAMSSDDSSSSSDDSGGADEGLMSCADDLLSAVDEGNTKGVMNALKNFIDQYQGSSASESGDEE